MSRESSNRLLFGVFLLQHLPVLCIYLFVCFHHCVSLLWAFCLILPLPHKTAPDGLIVPPGWIKFLFDVHLNPFPFFAALLGLSLRVVHVRHTSPFHKAYARMLSPIQSRVDRCTPSTPPPPPTHPPPPLNPSVAKPRCQTNARYKHTRAYARPLCARATEGWGIKTETLPTCDSGRTLPRHPLSSSFLHFLR